jgi:hypothetical protein
MPHPLSNIRRQYRVLSSRTESLFCNYRKERWQAHYRAARSELRLFPRNRAEEGPFEKGEVSRGRLRQSERRTACERRSSPAATWLQHVAIQRRNKLRSAGDFNSAYVAGRPYGPSTSVGKELVGQELRARQATFATTSKSGTARSRCAPHEVGSHARRRSFPVAWVLVSTP